MGMLGRAETFGRVMNSARKQRRYKIFVSKGEKKAFAANLPPLETMKSTLLLAAALSATAVSFTSSHSC